METANKIKMALTNAEKQKRYRERVKANPEKNSVEKLKRQKLNASRKKAEQLSDTEKKMQRKKWAKAAADYRKKKKAEAAAIPLTPPDSPISNAPLPVRGRKIVLRNRSKTFRDKKKLEIENSVLKQKLESQRKEIDKLKKRNQRMKNKEEAKIDRTPDAQLTPNSKAKKVLRAAPSTVRKELFKYNVLTKTLQNLYRKGNGQEKKTLGLILSDKLVKKCRLRTAMSSALGLQSIKRARENLKRNQKNEKRIKKFFLRDDVSFITAGKKETITKSKVKMQKRYLNHTMKHLHKIYNAEYRDTISYTTFIRYRPFYVLEPTADNRDTCRCKLHENAALMFTKLKQLQKCTSVDCHSLVTKLVCDTKKYDCMYGLCPSCKSQSIPFYPPPLDHLTNWKSWKTQTKMYEKPGCKPREVKYITKVEEEGTVGTLIKSFQELVPRFKRHIFNISTQSRAFNMCKERVALCDYEALIIIDFSENYSCKLSSEIQSYHFGGSRQQVALHTSAAYTSDGCKSFCTLSSSLDHSPAAIWAHLEPVLRIIVRDNPLVKTFHFFSDGPSSQYRQKGNFWLLCNRMALYGFHAVTWSFFESGHGKGEADGIGGAVKRSADSLVAHGTDIPNANIMFSELKKMQESKVTFAFVTQDEIDQIEATIPKKLETIKGTQKIHMVVASSPEKLFYRDVSCFCAKNKWQKNVFCECIVKSTKCYTYCPNPPQDLSVTPIAGPSLLPPQRVKPITVPPIPQQLQVTATALKAGTYVLINVSAVKLKRPTKYIYLAVCQDNYCLEDDELLVTYLRVSQHKTGEQFFRVDETDVSYVKFADVLEVLEEPVVVARGNRTYFKWNRHLTVFERK